MVPVAPGDSFEDQDASRELVHQEHVGEACQGEERERGRKQWVKMGESPKISPNSSDSRQAKGVFVPPDPTPKNI